ncbi:hypothetical protein [Aquabacterium sp.]|uniref:hypothetical protein n=1 Tax=Aquabacterium sp. TaxID=1872578 RepID=UPI002488F208|nr:hypothetical protein [Aquabacterium sp.]MDI1257912.1 hypothetical protein [Aquabacterium sp.]
MSANEENYLWEHWKFNADQRLKAFNFFVVFSIFANGGVFTAFDKTTHPIVLILLGGFVVFLPVYEKQLRPESRLFHRDDVQASRLVRFTVAFNALFTLQCFFGLSVVAYGAAVWRHAFKLP